MPSPHALPSTALVTGASSGIGLAFARALAAEGVSVVLVARREARLRDIVAALPGGPHRCLVADLATPAGQAAVLAELAAAPPGLLVNNAGIVVYGAFAATPLAQQQQVMRVNMDVVVALSSAFLARAKPGDALVNVASTLALLPYPSSAVYAATKAFTLSLTEALWFEQKDRGVHVMAVCPGATDTELHTVAGGKKPPPAVTQTPEAVVAEALAGLRRRSAPTVVSGATNRALSLTTRLMSRKAVVSMMGRAARKASAV